MNLHETNKRARFAIYVRYSSDMQNDMSLDAQEECCRHAIAERNGVVVDVYCDNAKSGWSLERDGFNRLRRDAEKGKFDAIMFWKFDRLARNQDHAVMIKVLLRSEYNLKLYCVEGFSEDDDDTSHTTMMEQMLAVFSAFYSKNLSTETKRGKKQRVLNGEFNGSIPPFGYDLVKVNDYFDTRRPGLYINPEQAQIIMVLFEMYATGQYSDASLARMINTLPYVQEIRHGRKLFGKGTIRDILRNRVYTGRVSYTETIYRGALGENLLPRRNREQWFEGKHEAIIDDDLFECCLQVRREATIVRRPVTETRTYILQNRVYCARCVASKPENIADDNWGKMRPNWYVKRNKGYYRCIAHNRGQRKCAQRSVQLERVNNVVIQALLDLEIPAELQKQVERAVQERVDQADMRQKTAELNKISKRINLNWGQGLLEPDEYMAKKYEIEAELANLRTQADRPLVVSADLLCDFRTHWANCDNATQPVKARKQLLAKIVERVFLFDESVIAIRLYGGYQIVFERSLPILSEI